MITVFGAQTKRVTLVTPVLTILLVLVLVWLTKKTKTCPCEGLCSGLQPP